MTTMIFTLLLGAAAVIQGGINRQVMNSWGVTSAILLNNSVILFAAVLLYVAVKCWPQFFPAAFRGGAAFSDFSWHYALPGLCGLFLVAGIPLAIGKIGALNVFLGIVCGQVVGSLIWDKLAFGIPLTWPRIAGAVFALIAVLLQRMRS